MKNLFSAALLLGFAASLSAAEPANQVKEEGILAKLKASPVGLNITSETGNTREDETNAINGYSSWIYTDLSYKIDSKNKLTLNPNINFSDTDESNSEAKMTDIGIKFGRSNLLSEDKHGVYAHAQLNYFINTDADSRIKYSNDGYAQSRLYIGKDLGSDFSVETQLRYYQYTRRNAEDKTRVNRYRVYLAPSYSITDKLSATFMTMFESNRDVAGNDSQVLLLEPTLAYAVNDNLSVETYVDMNPYTVEDYTFASADQWNNKVTYGLVVSMTAF